MEIIICVNGTLLKNFNRKFGVVDFRREHNIVNFRNDKWKIHNLSFFVHMRKNRWENVFYLGKRPIRNGVPGWDSSGRLSVKDISRPVYRPLYRSAYPI
jgi:hypothetical protein